MTIKYRCDHSTGTPNKELDLICRTCMMAWIHRHNKLLDFVNKLAMDLKYSSRIGLAIHHEAEELLREIGEL